jgi:hypothetical protein
MADLPEPKSRKEEYLATAAGMTGIELPEPASREEIYLDKIAQGGGGGGSSVNVVQITGQSTTDVMSQDAVSGLLFGDKTYKQKIAIGGDITLEAGNGSYLAIGERTKILNKSGLAVGPYAESNAKSVAVGAASFGETPTKATGSETVAVGYSDTVTGNYSIGIGAKSYVSGESSIAIGHGAEVATNNSVAIGRASKPTRNGEVHIGSINTNYGYNGSNYRVLGGVYDPQNAHDAATKGYVDGLVGNIEAALNAINNGGN